MKNRILHNRSIHAIFGEGIANKVDYIFVIVIIGTGIGITLQISDHGFYKSINKLLFDILISTGIGVLSVFLGWWVGDHIKK